MEAQHTTGYQTRHKRQVMLAHLGAKSDLIGQIALLVIPIHDDDDEFNEL